MRVPARADFGLRTASDNQAIILLKTNTHHNKMYIRWLDEIEDPRFSRVPGHVEFAPIVAPGLQVCGPGPAASTGVTDPESQQQLFSL